MKAAAYSRILVGITCLLLGSSMTTAEAAQAVSIARHGCKDRCGNVSIPFPWGSGPGCFLDEWHEIECREAASTKVPFFTKLGVQVLNLRKTYMDNGQDQPHVIIRMPYVNSCVTNALSTHTHHSALDNLRGSPYSISAELNVFVMEGCSGSAELVDESHPADNTTIGCATICHNNNTVIQANKCHGVKCCQSPLPYDLQSFQVRFDHQSIGDHSCLLATVVMSDHLDENVRKLSTDVPSNAAALVALRWRWRNNIRPDLNPYASCDDFNGDWECMCDEQNIGDNPYVSGGCQVPLQCKGCHRSCVPTDEYSNTYTCRSPFVKALMDSLTSALTSPVAIIVYIGLGVAIAPSLLVFGCRWLFRFAKRRRKAEKRVKFFKLMLQTHQSSNNTNGVVMSTKLFTHKELDKATEHFNDNRVLGKGGQGTVYKGMLTDGSIIAVKKSMQMDKSQMEQFINEVVILSQTNHRNVVKLLGCCLETDVPLLAYEFISNGTLYQHIHHPSEDVLLNWSTRLQIALESAGAIAYLHSSSCTPVYHRDIKSANILLDEKYRAKVSDFGSSKTIEIDQTHLTTLVQGTIGYLDPEYFESSVFTEKSDVYSFGVVMLELLTSKKPIFRNERMDQKSLVTEFFLEMQDQNSLSNILDPKVVKEAKKEEIVAYANLAKHCLNESGRLRPTMKEVAMTLEMIIKSSTTTYSLREGGLEDKRFDEIAMFDVSDVEFSSSSSNPGAPIFMYIDVEPLL